MPSLHIILISPLHDDKLSKANNKIKNIQNALYTFDLANAMFLFRACVCKYPSTSALLSAATGKNFHTAEHMSVV